MYLLAAREIELAQRAFILDGLRYRRCTGCRHKASGGEPEGNDLSGTMMIAPLTYPARVHPPFFASSLNMQMADVGQALANSTDARISRGTSSLATRRNPIPAK